MVNVKKLGVDTAPLVYFVEKNTTYFHVISPFFTKIDEGEIEAVVSVLGFTEVLPLPYRNQNEDLITAYRDILLGHQYLQVKAIDVEVAMRAANLRASYNLRTPDAIHLATALVAECDAFLTNDHQFKRVTDLNIIILDDLL